MKANSEELVSVTSAGGVRRGLDGSASQEGSGSRVSGFDRWLAAKMLEALGSPSVRLTLWDGSDVTPYPAEPVARVYIVDRAAFLKLLLNPELQFGELFSTDRVRVEGDLVRLLEAIYQARAGNSYGQLRDRILQWVNRPRKNTLAHARDNIHQHYDIGNDFYRLWLDEEMVYTCAYFHAPEVSLDAAQVAKLDHVCRKLRLQPGETVVEAGCGWGGLARHMAKHYGVKVRAFNISTEQVAYARERARKEGLDDRVEYVEADYRNISGQYDVFVSVGMLEHVGVEHYPELGGIMSRSLKGDGRGLIHTIGRDRPAPMNAWIERRIFAGAYPPSLGEMLTLFEPWGFSILDVENLRLHYARTLEHWMQRYEAEADRVEGMFDENFARAWRLYLAGSIAAFTTGELQLLQVSFARHGSNRIPWTREYIYQSPRA
jgi:cyclopropane-fatty-acyl-phospholipid synthase